MNKVKLRLITILSFAMLIALALGFAFSPLSVRSAQAISYTPTAIFAAGAEGSGDVKAYKKSAEETAYVAFVMKDGGNVYYRRKLALKWFEGKNDCKYFGMEFEFLNVNFDTFTLSFESAEENVSKEGKATNAVVFKKSGDKLTAYVKDAAGEESEAKELDSNEISLGFSEADCNIGEFAVSVNGIQIGKLTNVGGYYLDYRSSTATTPNTPITFTMVSENKEAVQKVLMKKLNGQSLAITDGGTAAETAESDGTFAVTDGKVTDDTPAVLVISEEIYHFILGQRFSLSYEAIDVCKDSVTVTRYSYMAKKDADDDALYVKPDEKYGSSDYKTITTSNFFMPTSDDVDEAYVSIRIYLDDGRSVDEAARTFVYLNWYAAEVEDDPVLVSLPVKAEESKPEEEESAQTGEPETFEFIRVIRNQNGPKYVSLYEEGTQEETQAVKDYREAVRTAAENLSAGTGSYFYLPSLRGLITSDYCDYRNLKFSVYYYKESQTVGSSATSATSLNYNALRFEISESGTYRFRVLAVDKANNGMLYTLDGEQVTVSATNIWDIEEIPEFTFEVKYTGAVIEEMKEQSNGYRDSSYTVSSFTVVALSGIEREYNLYRIDESKYESLPSYAQLVEQAKEYTKNSTEIEKADQWKLIAINEQDDELDEDEGDNVYQWNPSSSLSFVPKEAGFYIVQLIVTDPNRSSEQKFGYQVIQVQNPYDYTPGESQWLQNNLVSVVLFSISAILLVVIIVLFVSKPSEKKVEDIDLEKLKGKKKSKK